MNSTSREITGTGLRIIALITMFIDHIGAGIIRFEPVRSQLLDLYGKQGLQLIYKGFRGVGRLSFPIFAFLLVEGFIHTKNRWRYGLRLLALAIISEVPFDLLLRRSVFFPEYNNVVWELLLGLVVLAGLEFVGNLDFKIENGFIYNNILMAAIAGAGMLVGYYCHLDYKWAGICFISVIYKLYGYTQIDKIKAMGIGLYILLLYNRLEGFAFILLIPMYFYNGQRGRDSKGLRIFFYLFYPVHFLILYLIRLYLS